MSKLAILTTYSNFMSWKIRKYQVEQFIAGLVDQPFDVFIVECAYKNDKHSLRDSKNISIIPVRSNTVLWHKENMLNIAINRLIPKYDKFMWVDVDISFSKDINIVVLEVIQALNKWHTIQPWRVCIDDGDHSMGEGFCARACRNLPIIQGPNAPKGWKETYGLAQCGYSWALTKEYIDITNGLIDFCLLGGADSVMAHSLIGKGPTVLLKGLTNSFSSRISDWQQKAFGNLSFYYLENFIHHSYHGAYKNRKYEDRYQIFVNHDFDLDKDAFKNEEGLWEIYPKNRALIRDVEGYFESRKEDESVN